MAVITTVAAVAVVLAVTVLAVGATWQLSSVDVGRDGVDVGPVEDPTEPGDGREGAAVAASARGAVLRSDAAAIARQVSVLARMQGLEEVDVSAVLAAYPREVDGMRIEADDRAWASTRTITVSTEGAALCVRFPGSGDFTISECRR